MSFPYKYTVSGAVLHTFASAKKRHREQMPRIFDRLANDPFLPGDWIQKDSIGRDCQVKRFAGWAVTYWPEHFASQIHIIDVEDLS